MNDYPEVSIITPTLNSQRTLEFCLASIASQNYPGKVEMIVADGGSRDKTIQIAKKYRAKIYPNKLATGEAGKAVGARHARGSILAFIDSDNVLPHSHWLKLMVGPFLEDKSVVATEPAYFTYRKNDPWLTRYFALLGMGDPLNLFIGNYDRFSFISNRWTGLKVVTKNHRDYLEIILTDKIPTIGANGFFIRKSELEKYAFGDYLFDLDVLKYLVKKGPVKVIKVKEGIVHLFSGDILSFIRKQRRRIRDFLYFRKIGLRGEQTHKLTLFRGVLKFVFATLLIVPLLVQTALGYWRKPDLAWFFHPLACWLTLLAYTGETLRFILVKEKFGRRNWRQ